jgi:hypothetical protein
MPEFQTVEDFAPRISMPAHAVYRAIREKKFPFPVVRIGRQIRIDARSLSLADGQASQKLNGEPEVTGSNQ